jgi:hypothetical protein
LVFKVLESLDVWPFVLFWWGSSPEGLSGFHDRIAQLCF